MFQRYEASDDDALSEVDLELRSLAPLLKKLDPEFSSGLLRSLHRYSEHVRKADHSVFQDFIFPIPIPGLSA